MSAATIEDVRPLAGLFRAAAEVREKALETLTAYLERSWHVGQDAEDSAFQEAHRVPADDPDLPEARKVYLLETYRSLAAARAAASQIAFHARLDSRRLSDLLGRALDVDPAPLADGPDMG